MICFPASLVSLSYSTPRQVNHVISVASIYKRPEPPTQEIQHNNRATIPLSLFSRFYPFFLTSLLSISPT